MTRKHYTQIAQEFRDLLNVSSTEERRGVVGAISVVMTALKAENQAFNKDRFKEACGL